MSRINPAAMKDQAIICPHCQKEIALTEALSHDLKENFQKELSEKLKAQETELLKKAQTEANELVKVELADLQKQLTEKTTKVEELQNFELELRKEKRALEEEKKQQELALARKLDEERKTIEEAVAKRISEDHRLKEAEKDKLISDLKKDLEDAQRKATQGSQQMQGEVLELELEQLLKREFPLDNIIEVKKGIRGADILQEVVDRNGRVCGKILWETKNAEWSNQWPMKLREDQRNAKADLSALISINLPDGISNFVFRDGIWLCDLQSAMALAYALRFNLVQLQQVKLAASAKGEKKDELYDYITGLEFKHRVEAMIEAYQNLLKDIDQEKRWFTAKWAKQEKSLRSLLDQTGSFHGELESIVGSQLPPVKQFSLEDGVIKEE